MSIVKLPPPAQQQCILGPPTNSAYEWPKVKKKKLDLHEEEKHITTKIK